MSGDITKTGQGNKKRLGDKKPTIEQVADIIGSALFVAQNGGLVVEVNSLGSVLSIRIAGLTAVDDRGELQIVPLHATTPTDEMPLQDAATS